MKTTKTTPDAGSGPPTEEGWESPEMVALDALIRKTMKVKKTDIDRLLAEEKSAKRQATEVDDA